MADYASNLSLASLAAKLGGEVSNSVKRGAHVLCPGPGHGDGDRSLSVKPDANDPDGFVTHSFADDDWKLCREHVRKRLGQPEPERKKSSGNGKANGNGAGEPWKTSPNTSTATSTASRF